MPLPIICECPNKNKQTENALVKPTGKVKLVKLQFITSTSVYKDKSDEKTKEPIIYEIREGNDIVHWTSNESLYQKNGFPANIPVVIHSKEKFKIKAWLKVEGNLNVEPEIAISIPDLPKYTFVCDCLKGKTEGEFELAFEINNTPYEDEIIYISNLYVSFCYRVKLDEWQPAGYSLNKLYMTWNKPCYNYGAPRCESLFYLSCKQGYKSKTRNATIPDNEWGKEEIKNIADSIFTNLTSLNTRRVDETFADGMGYWRGISAVNSKKERYDESITSFIDLGEGTCGDWTELFLSLIQIHGFNEFLDRFNIQTPAYFINQEPMSNESYKFKNIIKRVKEIFRKPHNGDNKPENYVHYNEFVPSLFLIKHWNTEDCLDKNSKYPPKQLHPTMAQGNDNPVSVFWDHVFVTIKTGDGAYWYDPSYGIKSAQSFCDSRQLLADYTKITMAGILIAACPKDSNGSKMKENSSGLFIDILKREFKPQNKVSSYIYRLHKNSMEDITDYDYEQYTQEKFSNDDIVQIGYSKTYNLEHQDFQLIHKKYGYDIKVQYINHKYRYYVVPFDGDTDAEEALKNARTIIFDCFKSKLNNIPQVNPEDVRSEK